MWPRAFNDLGWRISAPRAGMPALCDLPRRHTEYRAEILTVSIPQYIEPTGWTGSRVCEGKDLRRPKEAKKSPALRREVNMKQRFQNQPVIHLLSSDILSLASAGRRPCGRRCKSRPQGRSPRGQGKDV